MVGWRGRVLVLPGCSYTGKSTLTHALIQLGADYYSDEYAVILDKGSLAPYRRKLTLRRKDEQETRLVVASVSEQERPASVHMVAFCPYVREARWQTSEMSPGQGVLGLFSNSVTAQQSPDRELKWLERSTRRARFLQSERGEAEAVARSLFKILQQ